MEYVPKKRLAEITVWNMYGTRGLALCELGQHRRGIREMGNGKQADPEQRTSPLWQ